MVDTSIMIEEYKKGASLAEIQRRYGMTPYSFKKILISNGIHVRSRNEQNKYSPQNQRKFTINDNYFSTQNADMAYILGFLAADGCVYEKVNEIKVALSSIDKPFLENVLGKTLGSTFPIHDYITKDGFAVSEVRYSSAQIKKDIAEYGIIPKKTYSLTFPKKLQKEFYLDFIRGYFDGDGSISTAGQGIRWQICAYNREILQSIIDILFEHDIPRVNIYKKGNTYYFQYSTKATKKIYNLLYYPYCLCLPRKYQKYTELVMK